MKKTLDLRHGRPYRPSDPDREDTALNEAPVPETVPRNGRNTESAPAPETAPRNGRNTESAPVPETAPRNGRNIKSAREREPARNTADRKPTRASAGKNAPEKRQTADLRPAGQAAAVKEEKVRFIFPSDKEPLGKASFWIKLSLICIAILLLVTSVRLILDYSRKNEERRILEAHLESLKNRKEELSYYIASPIDEYYVRKLAWELFGLVPADQKIFIVNP